MRSNYPTPGALLRKYGLSPKKQWGQNFLVDPTIVEAIVAATEATTGKRIVEIGAGLGALTARVLDSGAEVWAIERDRELCEVLRAELGGRENFRLLEDDAVRFDWARTYADGIRPTIVGNLPYHLTGPLLFALLPHHAQSADWIVMVQREVADRLAAPPGTKTYGGVSVVLGRVREISVVRRVAAGCFLPPPRVDSAVIRLRPREAALGEVGDPERFTRLVRAIFQRRRKTLLNALAGVADKERAAAWIEHANLDPKVRPERLTPAQFAAIERAREELDD